MLLIADSYIVNTFPFLHDIAFHFTLSYFCHFSLFSMYLSLIQIQTLNKSFK